MRVIVCGGRDYKDVEKVVATLNAYPIASLATGGAPGADSIAYVWAQAGGCPEVATYPADWATNGRAAGPIRNALMLADFKPDAVIAFPGGRGTADMVRRAKSAGVRVIVVDP